MNAIDVTNLPELMDFRNGYNGSSSSPSVIEVPHNPRLVYLNVSISESLEELILPENGIISGLLILAPGGFTPADLEGIITTLYNSAVASVRYGGYIDLQSPKDGAVTGPPTEATLDMLRSPRDGCRWNIMPEALKGAFMVGFGSPNGISLKVGIPKGDSPKGESPKAKSIGILCSAKHQWIYYKRRSLMKLYRLNI